VLAIVYYPNVFGSVEAEFGPHESSIESSIVKLIKKKRGGGR
jgi:hypothetical protein